MLAQRRPFSRAVLSLIVGACGWCGAARAQMTPAQLAPAIDAVIEARIEERGLLLACPGVDQRVRGLVPTAWDDMRRTLGALLWAADFPPAFVRGALQRVDPARLSPAAPEAESCNSGDMAKRRTAFGADTWSAELRLIFKGLELPSAIPVPTEAQWARAKAAAAREGAAQAKLLNCLSVLAANLLPIAMADWARATGEARRILESNGFPRDEIAALYDPLAPEKLLAPPADRAGARAACRKDRSWQERYELFNTGAILFETREIVTGKR